MQVLSTHHRLSTLFCLCTIFLFLSFAGVSGVLAGKVDVNTATAKELQMVPGVGKEIATRIVEYRQDHGPFTSLDELKNIKGIGKGKFAQLQEFTHIPIATKSAERP